MLTIDKTKVDEIIDGLLGNNDLTASPEVWYGLHQIKNLPVTEIITCGECIYRYVEGNHVRFNRCELNHNNAQSDDWYCGDAERRTDE